jgi:membrane associated rhomboid family serine protease
MKFVSLRTYWILTALNALMAVWNGLRDAWGFAWCSALCAAFVGSCAYTLTRARIRAARSTKKEV